MARILARSTALLAILHITGFICFAQLAATTKTTSISAGSTATATTAYERIKALEGEWEAPLKGKQEGKVMVNTFHVIGEGSAVVHGEWLDGKQLTTTIFYLVGSELRADHYCDLQNQPRYTVRPSSDNILSFELRDITNLDAHPRHFHSTTWHFLDATHLTQDWEIVENGKPPKVVRMEFTRTKSPNP